ncbi:hypothetical protein K458DRAFT_306194, partial [Lentithecium fluviatile CBS 122367]
QLTEFASSRDPDLVAYLDKRNVTVSFLAEIDQFLSSHPEISSCSAGRRWLRKMNSLSPLDAYRYFIKGYTRPARYPDGVIVSEGFVLPVGYRPSFLTAQQDPELDDIFDRYKHRPNVLELIDRVVRLACSDLDAGRFVKPSIRRLICYVVGGNVADAYKWYEYHVQEEYMPHRCLPEHLVLGKIPKPATYTEPIFFLEVYGLRTHGHVRGLMARAKDQGVGELHAVVLFVVRHAEYYQVFLTFS